ncbi:MAG: hypothetical protein AAGJ46_14130 [Planctomycetota bacterium]
MQSTESDTANQPGNACLEADKSPDGDFPATVATATHKLNNVLQAVLGGLEYAMDVTPKDAEAAEPLAQATEAALRGAEMVKRLQEEALSLSGQQVAVSEMSR